MNTLKQMISVTELNLRGLPGRIVPSLVIVAGIAGTVAVLVSVLAMATGFLATAQKTGRDDRAIVIRLGSDSESTSTLARSSVLTITAAPGIRRDAQGHPIASAEGLVIVNLARQSDGLAANIALRGVGPQAAVLRPEIKLIEGRMFRPGARELIVGKAAAARFRGLSIGSHVAFRGDWTVVGHFESGGDAHESELMTDAETLLSVSRRNAFQLVMVQLDFADAFPRFRRALSEDPTLAVDAIRETEYMARASRQLTRLMYFAAYFVGGIMAVGALFGSLNSFYAALDQRAQEIATLRSIGFRGRAVVAAILVEALLLALLGGILGAVLARLLFDGNAINTLGGNISQVVFKLTVTPYLAMLGVVCACAIGLAGGLPAAIRAARQPIARGLMAT